VLIASQLLMLLALVKALLRSMPLWVVEVVLLILKRLRPLLALAQMSLQLAHVVGLVQLSMVVMVKPPILVTVTGQVGLRQVTPY
jgi:hypothetical protein